MTRQLRVLDCFCKAGGAGEGYRRAGLEVEGWDIEDQPRNPHIFRQGNVLLLELDYLRQFDLLHFSSPCQGYTEMRHAKGAKGPAGHPLLLAICRNMAQMAGVPYVSENVRDAAWDMVDPVALTGRMFGLTGYGGVLLRTRLFEASFPLNPLPKENPALRELPVIGVYGEHVRRRAKRHGGRGTAEHWVPKGVSHKMIARELMGIDWMEMDELSEAIPPAYTEWVGRTFLEWKARGL